MPTGYTAAIEDGCTFEEFVWRCARNFGALVMMRDEPLDAPIPEQFEPSDCYATKIKQAQDELERLSSMTRGEVVMAIAKERETIAAENARRAVEWSEKEARYREILSRVERWQPPSPDHANLKTFMVEQIEISRHDAPYQRDLPEADPDAWLLNKKWQAQRDWEYALKMHEEEIERTNGRNRWLQQLRESVPQPQRAAKETAP